MEILLKSLATKLRLSVADLIDERRDDGEVVFFVEMEEAGLSLRDFPAMHAI
jgi:hypothetical protein